ncbi:MAG TPA: outer membrane lipoprotein-sorting protein [Caldimonas sp.]|jgi:hypothetical protein|nr:outer membrane lipoprotein-sorting protein [Caldimonas sp.]
MKRAVWSLVFCAASLVGPDALAADLTVAQIVDRNVAARGGLQSWRAVNSMTFAGEMDAGGKKDTKLPFVFTLKRPHKSRLELRFEDQAAVQTWDGVQGWKLRPFLGRTEAEPFSAAEARSAAADDELDGPLVDYARKGSRVELVGMDKVEGRSTYKLKIIRKTGEARHLWLDASTFLEAKIDGEPRKLDGKLHKVAVYYRDFKSESGLNVPHTIETFVDGVKGSHKMTIQTVSMNPAVDDSRFAKPQLALASATRQ